MKEMLKMFAVVVVAVIVAQAISKQVPFLNSFEETI